MTKHININNLTLIEKKYIILSNFWCKENNIRIEMTDCIPLGDGSYDDHLLSRSDTKNNKIYLRKDIDLLSMKDEKSHLVINIINAIIPFIYKSYNTPYTNQHLNTCNELIDLYLFKNYSFDNIKADNKFIQFNMEKIFEFIIWLKEKANA